jgi:uncharacterized protein (UPF0333 family)
MKTLLLIVAIVAGGYLLWEYLIPTVTASASAAANTAKTTALQASNTASENLAQVSEINEIISRHIRLAAAA